MQGQVVIRARAMQNDSKNVFAHIARKEPSSALYNRIIARIEREERKTGAYARIVFFGVAALVSVAAFVPAAQELYAEFSQSGFIQFLSLLFSDTGVIALYWQDFLMSLAETLPVFGIMGVAASMFVMLLSTRYLVNDVRSMWGRSGFAHS